MDRRLPSTGEYETTLPAERIENQLLLKGVWTTLRSITLYNFVRDTVLYLVIQLKYDDPEQGKQNAIVSFLYKMIPVVVFFLPIFQSFLPVWVEG